MSWIAVGVIAGGAIGSGIVSSNAQGDAADATGDLADQLRALGIEIEFEDTFAFQNPNLGNAGLAGVTASGLAQLGLPIGNALQQGSPIGSLQNAAGAAGLSEDEFKQTSNQIRKAAAQYNRFRAQGLTHAEAARRANRRTDSGQVRRIAGLAGYTNLGDLYQDQFQYELQVDEFERMAAEIAPQVQAGRISAIQAIASIQQNFTSIDELEQRLIAQGDLDLDERQREADERTLQAANTFGLNPARGLADTAEQTAELKQDLRFSDALIKAIQLGIGQTSVVSGIQNTLNAPNQALLQAAGLTSQGSGVQGTIAANQANNLNSIRGNIAIQEALANQGLTTQAAGLDASANIQQSNADAALLNSIIGGLTTFGAEGLDRRNANANVTANRTNAPAVSSGGPGGGGIVQARR